MPLPVDTNIWNTFVKTDVLSKRLSCDILMITKHASYTHTEMSLHHCCCIQLKHTKGAYWLPMLTVCMVRSQTSILGNWEKKDLGLGAIIWAIGNKEINGTIPCERRRLWNAVNICTKTWKKHENISVFKEENILGSTIKNAKNPLHFNQ